MGSYKWGIIEKFGQYSVQLILSIILTRLLEPKDFGAIAILNVILILSNIIVEGGLTQSLIRKKVCNNSDFNSVFWFNLIVSGGLYILLYFSAPLIIYIFPDEAIINLSRVLFLVIPLGAFNIIQSTILVKKLDFRRLAIFVISSSVISGIIGVILANAGFAVWSLVFQIVLNAVFLTIFYWSFSSWRPKAELNIGVIKEFFPFSSKLLASSLLNNLFNNIYIIFIAKFFSPSSLGIYSQANRYGTQPGILVDAVLTRVTFPILAN